MSVRTYWGPEIDKTERKFAFTNEVLAAIDRHHEATGEFKNALLERLARKELGLEPLPKGVRTHKKRGEL